MKKICIFMACHTDSLKRYFTVLNNIKELNKFCTDFYIINSVEAKYSKNLHDDLNDLDCVKEYHIIENNVYYDFGKWIHLLGQVNYKLYDYVLFTNDSILIIEKLDNFFHYIENLEDNINIYGYNDSTQLGIYHYQSYMFLIKTKIMNKFINHFQSKKHLVHNQDSLIKHMELNLNKIDKNTDCFLKIAKEWNQNKNIFWENDELYENMLERNIFHLLKLKKINDYINFYKHNIENYGDYFDADFYKKNYNDLDGLSKEELFNHFKGYGFQEGRNCVKKFYHILPKIYIDKLKDRRLDNIFNINENIDIYYYKSFNTSIKNKSVPEIIQHIFYEGLENEEIMLQNGYNDNIIKNEMYEYYIKTYFNINVKLDKKFNFIKLISYNNDLKESGILKNIIKYFYRNDLIPNINLDDYIMEIQWIKRLNPDYQKMTDSELIKEFHDKLKNNDFKTLKNDYLNFYKEYYNLVYYDTEYIKYHYKFKESLNENNIIDCFDGYHYKLLNRNIPGISNLSDDNAKHHYFTQGYKQQLPYKLPNDFNPIHYKYLHYTEFKNLEREELIEHYLTYGHHEKRNYKLPIYYHSTVFKLIFQKKENTEEQIVKEFVLNHLKNDKTRIAFITFYNLHPKYEYIIDEILPSDFDVEIYKCLNNDLINISNHKAKIHFIEYGFNEKRFYKMPVDFDINMYKKMNDDLKKVPINELYRHYYDHGIKEDRPCNISKQFRIKFYKRLNPDLIKMNQETLLKHYIDIGIEEKRPWFIPLDFVPENYKKLYKDLQKLSDDELYTHYAKLGLKEKRIYKLQEKFNPENYRKFYKDVTDLNDEEALYHYVNKGRFENRISEIPKDFNVQHYKNLHFDLSFMNDNEVLEHFIYHGIAEKRQYKGYNKYFKEDTSTKEKIKKEEKTNIVKQEVLKNNNLPKDFTVHGYRVFNPDLFYYDNDEYLIKHYLQYGVKENRLYKMPADFNVEMYKRLNPELLNMSNNKAIDHFKTCGNSENRLYKFPEDFDYNFYRKVYLNNDKSYDNNRIQNHYLETGIKKKNWIKLPSDFDLNIYKKLNRDLETLSDDEIIKQYVKIGYKTRIYK